MKIITVNIPISYLKAIKKLVGSDGLYPSRSELIRVAIRDFIHEEAENFLVEYKKLTHLLNSNNSKIKIDPSFIEEKNSDPSDYNFEIEKKPFFNQNNKKIYNIKVSKKSK